MEKTIQITIASTTFSLTESAYAKLSAYLDTLKTHFAEDADRDEILRDIESRIAEKLLHAKGGVITESNVTAVIAEIGEPSEFDESSEDSPSNPRGAWRLYRDADNGVIAGVCAGLAAFFNIDPLIPRIIFIISLFGGGAGILVYILLWILVPEAKTAGQKLEMRGAAVNLENIRRFAKDRVEEVRERGSVGRLRSALADILRLCMRIIGRIAGGLFALGAVAGLVGVTIALGIILTNWNAPYNDFPLREWVSTPLLLGGVLTGYLAILIPLILVFALGLRMTRRIVIFPTSVSAGLLGLWALIIIVAGILGVKIAGEAYAYRETDPTYIETSVAKQVPAFDAIKASGAQVVIRNGETQSVEIEGRAVDIDRISLGVNDGVLTVNEMEPEDRPCIFCIGSSPSVVVTVPNLASVEAEDVSIRFDDFSAASLSVEVRDGTIRGFVSLDALDLKAQDSSISMEGVAQSANLDLVGTSLRISGLLITDAHILARRTFAHVNISGRMEVDADSGSLIENDADSEI